MKFTEVPTFLLRNLFSGHYWRAVPNKHLSYWASYVSAVSLIFVGFCVTGSRCRIGVKLRLEGTLIPDGIVIPVCLCYWITSRLKVIELKLICLQINVRLLQTAAQSVSNYPLNDSAKISKWLAHTIHGIYNWKYAGAWKWVHFSWMCFRDLWSLRYY